MSLIGTPAPPFVAPCVNAQNKIDDFRSEDHKGKWLVLFFYPLDFTFVCPTEILQFRDAIAEFNSRKAVVAGLSIDSVYAHQKWIESDLGPLGFALVSDLKKQIARDYDCYLEESGIATRATYIIDPKGLIQYASMNNTSVGRDVKEILRVLDALQSGELCAAGWKKGDTFIKG
jgi:peroxiredoxin 2/4